MMTRKVVAVLTCIVSLIAIAQETMAADLGNVVVKGSGTFAAISGTFPFAVGTFSFPSTNTTAYKISILANISGVPQPQYIVDTLNQVGSASSGTATVFNNGFLGGGPNGSVFSGTWTGTFAFDQFADFNITSLVITTGTGANACTLTFSNGQAVAAF